MCAPRAFRLCVPSRTLSYRALHGDSDPVHLSRLGMRPPAPEQRGRNPPRHHPSEHAARATLGRRRRTRRPGMRDPRPRPYPNPNPRPYLWPEPEPLSRHGHSGVFLKRRIACGSAKEIDTHLQLLVHTKAIDATQAEKALSLFDDVRAIAWRTMPYRAPPGGAPRDSSPGSEVGRRGKGIRDHLRGQSHPHRTSNAPLLGGL